MLELIISTVTCTHLDFQLLFDLHEWIEVIGCLQNRDHNFIRGEVFRPAKSLPRL